MNDFIIDGDARPTHLPRSRQPLCAVSVLTLALGGCIDIRLRAEGGYCEYSKGCPVGGDVVLCMFDGMLHGWAGAPTFGPGGLYAGGESYESATELIWGFFADQL